MVTARRKGQLYLAAIAVVLAGFAIAPARLKAQDDPAKASATAADFAGTWRLMFQGKQFATMTIEQHGDQITGSLTAVSIELNDAGKITSATATNGATSTLRASLERGVMHLFEMDGDDEIEFVMALKSADAAELRFGKGGPGNADPIRLERGR